ncbi:hypothetical protein BCR41DRAFT_396654 [Lobosporangium transversale]|uniref:Uncharacterized protein n=1 Tax=Lobosporangium transversale TaxID=64571 RepID=A0A1Y2GLZ7_9FUNG|nr:hypothetical protein BCR41DRAFT_396654 [Lobosporangium transversale]ORZ14932.1 hypothetical protein BCR41DRAFT_396654 [Lobosporangium transversale]|eukprot:XP_021881064.1 hypothetical protein BCR41DRAFT_396654 [Lobosporangium transversale]
MLPNASNKEAHRASMGRPKAVPFITNGCLGRLEVTLETGVMIIEWEQKLRTQITSRLLSMHIQIRYGGDPIMGIESARYYPPIINEYEATSSCCLYMHMSDMSHHSASTLSYPITEVTLVNARGEFITYSKDLIPQLSTIYTVTLRVELMNTRLQMNARLQMQNSSPTAVSFVGESDTGWSFELI